MKAACLDMDSYAWDSGSLLQLSSVTLASGWPSRHAAEHNASAKSREWGPPDRCHAFAEFSPERTAFTCEAPALEGTAVLRLKPPDVEAMRAAVTQAQVAALAAQVH